MVRLARHGESKLKEKKPRSEYVYARTVGEVSQIKIEIDEENGEVIFHTHVENTYSEATYERKKGAKVLNRTPISGQSFPIAPNDVLSKYDLMIAVDTNTKKINNIDVSVTGIVLAADVEIEDGSKLEAYFVPFCIVFCADDKSSEKYGWNLALSELYERGLVCKKSPIALIVDSYFSEISEINERKRPYFENLPLPRNVTMIYSSSDAGAEYRSNRYIRLADRSANETISQLERIKFWTSGFNPSRIGIISGRSDKKLKEIEALIRQKINNIP